MFLYFFPVFLAIILHIEPNMFVCRWLPSCIEEPSRLRFIYISRSSISFSFSVSWCCAAFQQQRYHSVSLSSRPTVNCLLLSFLFFLLSEAKMCFNILFYVSCLVVLCAIAQEFIELLTKSLLPA